MKKCFFYLLILGTCITASAKVSTRDSTQALFFRVGLKTFNRINDRLDIPFYKRDRYHHYKSYGYFAGIRHSKVLPSQTWTIVKSVEVHYDYSQLGFYLNHRSGAIIGKSYTETELLSSTLAYGVKYNKRLLRPALSFFLNSNILSRTNAIDSIANLSGLFNPKQNKLQPNKMALGLKLEFLIPLHKKFGLVFTGSGALLRNIAGKDPKYSFGSDYLGLAMDYKISR